MHGRLHDACTTDACNPQTGCSTSVYTSGSWNIDDLRLVAALCL
ncbi:hypothetical protein [Polyangium spumosum]|nr:hypothetical protein [Polyangium spumosum]